MNKLRHFVDESGRILGAVTDMPEEEYFAVKAASYSGLKHFEDSPAHYKAYRNEPFELKPSREKFKAAHLLTLEADKRSRLVVKDGTWAGKLKDEVLELKKQGKLVVKQKAYEEATAIATALATHKITGPVITRALCEVSLFWIRDGVYCKCRIDILDFLDDGTIHVADLKNFGNLSSNHLIHYQIDKEKYHWQMAFYGEGVRAVFGKNPTTYKWFFVEESAPHGVRVKNCPEALIEVGSKIFTLLPRFQECQNTGIWPGYAEEEDDAGLPAYAFTEAV